MVGVSALDSHFMSTLCGLTARSQTTERSAALAQRHRWWDVVAKAFTNLKTPPATREPLSLYVTLNNNDAGACDFAEDDAACDGLARRSRVPLFESARKNSTETYYHPLNTQLRTEERFMVVDSVRNNTAHTATRVQPLQFRDEPHAARMQL